MGFVYVINSWKGCNMGFLCFFVLMRFILAFFWNMYIYIYILDVFVFVYIGIIDRIHRDIYIYIWRLNHQTWL